MDTKDKFSLPKVVGAEYSSSGIEALATPAFGIDAVPCLLSLAPPSSRRARLAQLPRLWYIIIVAIDGDIPQSCPKAGRPYLRTSLTRL